MATDTGVTSEPHAPGFWDPETDNRLVCIDVYNETHDVKSFTLASPQGKRNSMLR